MPSRITKIKDSRVFDTPWKIKCHAKGSKLDVAKLSYNPAQVLRFSNIPSTLTVSELESHCAAFGPVLMTHMSKQSVILALGTVVMENIDDARDVTKELNGAFCGVNEIIVVTLTAEFAKRHKYFIQAPTKNTEPQNTFTCFEKRPAEIRIPIRRESQSPGRVAQLELRHTGFKSRTPVPFKLHVCRESRTEALEVYELAYAVPSEPWSATTYFDFDKDELYLSVPARNIFPAYPKIIDYLVREDKVRTKVLTLDINNEQILHEGGEALLELSRYDPAQCIGFS